MDTYEKAWGSYIVYNREQNCVLKKLIIKPKQAISYQFHLFRDEFWFVSSGSGILTLNDLDNEVYPGDNFKISKKDKHRIYNNTDKDLIIYEMQFGEKCSEDDIVRLSDFYGRK